ncbi:DeoR family transcriptional regulator [Barrientosiimonas marina]|uniref:HTH domain-containing protein n=1 Tax=Lentibacillus kimchii TaxID=1542911 RepID=A0ABW2UT12_9BACI
MSHSTSRMLTRVKAVYLYIREQGTVSTQKIAEEFGTTRRTVQRDLSILTYNGLVQSPNKGNWKITNKRVKIPDA